MRMSSGASNRYEKPRSGRSSCGLLTPRSIKMPITGSPLAVALDQLGELLETTFHHLRPIARRARAGASGSDGVGVTVDPEQAEVGPSVEQRATSGLRHPPCSRRSIRPARAGGAPPPPGPSPGDARTPPPHPSPRTVSPEPHAAAGPVSSPPVDRHRPGCRGPGRQRLIAGGVGANNRAGRGAGDGPGNRAPLFSRTVDSEHVACAHSTDLALACVT